jgi:siroheme synthase-like protein
MPWDSPGASLPDLSTDSHPVSEPLYPVALRLRDRPVLVVGGGPVAARKVRRLRECGARITLIAPEAVTELAEAAEAGTLRWHRRPFDRADVQGHDLVFAATGVAAVDEAVAGAARAARVWLNAADSGVDGDLDLPALLRRGDLTVAVSTGGAAPGFAAELVAELGAQLTDRLGDYVALLQSVRAELRARFPDDAPLRHQAFAAALACVEARGHAEGGRLDEARRALDRATEEVALPALGDDANG